MNKATNRKQSLQDWTGTLQIRFQDPKDEVSNLEQVEKEGYKYLR